MDKAVFLPISLALSRTDTPSLPWDHPCSEGINCYAAFPPSPPNSPTEGCKIGEGLQLVESSKASVLPGASGEAESTMSSTGWGS